MPWSEDEERLIWKTEQAMLPFDEMDCFVCRGKRVVKFYNGTQLLNIFCPECGGKGDLLSCVGLVIAADGDGDFSCAGDDSYISFIRCSSCGDEMKLRRGEFGEFYGCVNFPTCRAVRFVDVFGRVELPIRLVPDTPEMIRE